MNIKKHLVMTSRSKVVICRSAARQELAFELDRLIVTGKRLSAKKMADILRQRQYVPIAYKPFLPRDAMHKRGLCRHAVSVCLSISLSRS